MNKTPLFLVALVAASLLFLGAGPGTDSGRLVSKAEFFDGRSDWLPAGAVASWAWDGPDLVVALVKGRPVRFSFASPTVFRMVWDPANRGSGEPSPAVISPVLGTVDPKVTESASALVIDTGSMRLEVTKVPFGVRVFRGETLVAATARPPAVSGFRVASFWTMAPADRFYGLGEKAGPFLKNGQSLKMWNTDAYGWGRATDPLYIDVPFFLSARPDLAWGLFLDNTRQTYFDLGRGEAGTVRVGAVDGPLDLWFFAGDQVPQVVSSYTALTGRIPLPPAWSMGYQQSKYSYTTQAEVLATAQKFLDDKLPARVIYLDIDYMDGYKSFTVNPSDFPDPKGMVDKLHQMGFKVVAIVDPGIAVEPGYPVYDSGVALGAFFRDETGDLLTGKVWPGICAFPDFRSEAVRAWWGQQYKVLTDLGIDGFWNDMNEPSVFGGPAGTLSLDPPFDVVHNVYGHLMVQATRVGLETLRPGIRPYVLSRDGYAGTQRYAIHWTGDNSANWDHLKLNLTMVLNLGLSGYALTGADVGGYKGTPDDELFVRWMQLGSLMPFYRNHTEKGHDGHEPWQFGRQNEALARAALEFRRGLEPYLYDLTEEASATGAPLVRPLFWSFPGDEAAGADDEFLLGEALLAAPVLTPGAQTRAVRLPAGADWYDWSTGQKYAGGQTVKLAVDLGSIPLFARAGSVVPWDGKDGLEFRVFPGLGPSHRFYADDGVTTGYQSGAFLLSTVQAPAASDGDAVWTTVTDGWKDAPRSAVAVYPDGRRTTVSR